MQTQPRITVAICTYNRADYLRDTLCNLAEQNADPRIFEILVVNNNSTDHTEKICKEFQEAQRELNVRIIHEREQGLSYARNRAARESRAPVLLYIDDDVFLPAEFLQEALSHIETCKAPYCAGGKIDVDFEGESGKPSWIPGELMPMFGLHKPFDKEQIYSDRNFPRGGNMVIHRSVFKEAGYFKTELGRTGRQLLGGEEKAFFDKVRRKRIPLYYWPSLHLTHRIGKARLEKEYIKEQSIGIGQSEWLRVCHNPADIVHKSAEEAVKFAGSILLFLWYGLTGRWKAARFLMAFRIWVLSGFLGSKFGRG